MQFVQLLWSNIVHIGLYALFFGVGIPQPHIMMAQIPTRIKPVASHVLTTNVQAATVSATPTVATSPTPIPQQLAGYCLTVPVLYYHHVQPNSEAVQKGQTSLSVDSTIFEHQMEYLSTHGYTVVSADVLVNALRNKTTLAPKTVVVTLDDGYKDAYTYAYPTFKKYNMKASLLIPTGLLEGSDYLTWGQLKEMVNSNNVFVLNHTWSHYGVGYGKQEKIEYEIQTAEDQLKSNGIATNIFGYPYGSFSPLSIQILQQKGFIGAYSTLPGTVQCDSFIMTLHRTRIGNEPLSAYGF